MTSIVLAFLTRCLISETVKMAAGELEVRRNVKMNRKSVRNVKWVRTSVGNVKMSKEKYKKCQNGQEKCWKCARND